MGRHSVFRERDIEIATRFLRGDNQILLANEYGLSRQRINQIAKRYGLTREDGGQSVELAGKREAAATAREKKKVDKLNHRGLPTGVSFDQRTGLYRAYKGGKSLGYFADPKDAIAKRETV